MNLQKSIIKKYLSVHKNPTHFYISRDLGLDMTRVHRIFSKNYEMKISEYDRMLKSIEHGFRNDLIVKKVKEKIPKIKTIQTKETKKPPVIRICLKCDAKFESNGNRLCQKCKCYE